MPTPPAERRGQSKAVPVASAAEKLAARQALQAAIGGFLLSSPEEQAGILDDMVAPGGSGGILSPDAVRRGTQAAGLADHLGVDIVEGADRLTRLEGFADTVPGIRAVLRLLAVPIPMPGEKAAGSSIDKAKE